MTGLLLLEADERWSLARVAELSADGLEAAIATLEQGGSALTAANAAELLCHLRFAQARNAGDPRLGTQVARVSQVVRKEAEPTRAARSLQHEAALAYDRLYRRVAQKAGDEAPLDPQGVWQALRRNWRAVAPECAALLRPFSGASAPEPSHRFGLPLSVYTALEEALRAHHGWISGLAEHWSVASGRGSYRPWHGTVLKEPASAAWQVGAERSIAIIAAAFDAVDPAFGACVHDLARRGLIDAEGGSLRQDIAFCAVFASSVEPRVFAKLDGSFRSLSVLTHEIGHAVHHILAAAPQRPGVALSETAAILAERWLWSATSMSGLGAQVLYLATTPTLVRFERSLADHAGVLRPDELNRWMADALEPCFGRENARLDCWMWQRVPHLYQPGARYAGLAYTFAYLLSGRLARKLSLADYRSFFSRRDAASLAREGERLFARRLDDPIFWDELLREERDIAVGTR